MTDGHINFGLIGLSTLADRPRDGPCQLDPYQPLYGDSQCEVRRKLRKFLEPQELMLLTFQWSVCAIHQVEAIGNGPRPRTIYTKCMTILKLLATVDSSYLMSKYRHIIPVVIIVLKCQTCISPDFSCTFVTVNTHPDKLLESKFNFHT